MHTNTDKQFSGVSLPPAKPKAAGRVLRLNSACAARAFPVWEKPGLLVKLRSPAFPRKCDGGAARHITAPPHAPYACHHPFPPNGGSRRLPNPFFYKQSH